MTTKMGSESFFIRGNIYNNCWITPVNILNYAFQKMTLTPFYNYNVQ